jgi:anti-sigma28 factor (negative regulator of flagellin synthesis)
MYRRANCFDSRARYEGILSEERKMQIYGPSHLHGAQSIGGPHSSRAVQPPATSNNSSISDQLDISDAARLADRVAELPEIRADRVAELRSAIMNGTYETQDKLATAVDRLFDEIA